jgi:hypothetical protein
VPADLREKMAKVAQGMAARYQPAPRLRVARKA